MIKNLRVSGTTVQADVAIGKNDYGSDVSVQLRLQRKDPDVVDALASLENLLLREAKAYCKTSIKEAEIRAEVDRRVRDKIDARVKAATESAENAAGRKFQTLELLARDQEQTIKRLKARVEELVELAEASTTPTALGVHIDGTPCARPGTGCNTRGCPAPGPVEATS